MVHNADILSIPGQSFNREVCFTISGRFARENIQAFRLKAGAAGGNSRNGLCFEPVTCFVTDVAYESAGLPCSLPAPASLRTLRRAAESQRDSATEPRAPRNELPW